MVDDLELEAGHPLRLSMDGYVLPPDGLATLVRDGDSVVLERQDMAASAPEPPAPAAQAASPGAKPRKGASAGAQPPALCAAPAPPAPAKRRKPLGGAARGAPPAK